MASSGGDPYEIRAARGLCRQAIDETEEARECLPGDELLAQLIDFRKHLADLEGRPPWPEPREYRGKA